LINEPVPLSTCVKNQYPVVKLVLVNTAVVVPVEVVTLVG